MTNHNTDGDDGDDGPVAIEGEWPRRGCIRITLPNTDPDADGPRYTSVESLAPLVRRVLEKQNSVNRLEILSWPGEHQQEWILFPDSETAQSLTDYDEGLGEVDDTHQLTEFGGGVTSDREEHSSITGALKAVIDDDIDGDDGYEDVLPAELGYDICDIDFSPIERTIRPTCRLVVPSSPDLQPLRRKEPHPIADLITDLNQDDVFYILQTIVSVGHGSADYELSQRLAVYPPEYGIGVQKDFIDLLKHGPPIDLSDYYDPYLGVIQSNFDLDGRDFFTIEGSGPEATVKKRSDRGDALVERARRILDGKLECHRLYAGYHETNQDLETLYRHRDYYTKIPVNGAALDAFLDFVPDYIDYPPSEAVNYVTPPKLISRPERLPAERFDTEDTTPTAPSNQSAENTGTPHPTRGSKKHRFTEDSVAEYYRDRGFDVEQPDTKIDGSVPDLILHKDDTTYVGEVENTGKSRPANILTNAARAVHYDVPVYFFTEDKSAAQTVADILRHPVRTNTDRGARLYTQSRALSLDDGGWPLLPADASKNESKWYLVNDNPEPEHGARLELRANGEVIASGPADESVTTFEYDTQIEPAGGPVPSGRTRIHPPFVPTKLAYLKSSTIRYQRGNKELTHFERDDYQPGWNYTNEEGKRTRYRAAFGQFIADKTIKIEGAELLKHDTIDTLLEELYNPQTSRKTPGIKEAARALWKHAEKKSRTEDADSNDGNADASGKTDLLRDRHWRWPPDITSPDHSFINDTQTDFDLTEHL